MSWLLAVVAGCRPSASVEQTLPVANLQTYRTVALRVKSTAFASQGHAMYLETAVINHLQQRCKFDQVGRASGAPADVLLDLNITNVARGGDGWVSNSSQASIDTLLVVSDGLNGELLGTARIRGKSSGMMLNNAPPESEAIEVVAKTVADVLAKSGCSGPRIARAEPTPETPVEPPPVTPGEPSVVPPDESRRAEAEAINEDGKVKLRGADIPGAIAAFQQANALLPDARYQFNVCLALEAQERWADAITACRAARSLHPQPKLVEKIDRRLELLQQHR
ncbi:MAG: hypothetical protein H0T79_02625 [Deltaproteobacteria bacterium]|nr:hypothetical protein [Deltaproteobacteria bacterium]